MRSVPTLSEAERWQLFAELSGGVANGAKRSARALLGTLEPASAVDPQERVRRLRDEWGGVTLAAAFAGVRSVLFDTGPTIYALEKNVEWGSRTRAAVEYLFDANVTVVATPVTPAECVAGATPADVQTYVEFLTLSQEVRSCLWTRRRRSSPGSFGRRRA